LQVANPLQPDLAMCRIERLASEAVEYVDFALLQPLPVDNARS
jgi:hypothetical protein